MPDNRLTAEKLAAKIAKQTGFDEQDASDFSEEMLLLLVAGQVVGEVDGYNTSPEAIEKEKLRLRHWYILLVEQLPNVFNKDPIEPIPKKYGSRSDFIWELVRTLWITGKSTDILDKIEIMLDGSVSGTPYNIETDRRKDGKLVRTIIEECFITGECKSFSKEQLAERYGISISTLDNKRQAGMAIFGMMMFLYATKRECEDMKKGIIPWPAKRKWWMK